MTVFFEIMLVALCVAVVFGVSFSAIKRKKKGKSAFGCGGDCAHCSACVHKKKINFLSRPF